jgi:CubicO group peptidase (beta-lactamase class C family)
VDKLAPLPPQPSDVQFPTAQWPTGKAESANLEVLVSGLLADQARYGETHALLAVHGGRLVIETYDDAHGPDETYRSWSMAKSALHALVGLLSRDGRLLLDGRAEVPRWQTGDPRHEITLEHLLRMKDGLDFTEEYVPDVGSDVIPMLFQEGKDDVAAFAEDRGLAHPPGTHWNYSSGTSNILSAIVGRAIGGGEQAVLAYMRRELFDPIGMRSADPRFDAAGTFIGSSYLFATARDFARFGLLYLRDGVWDGKRILPKGWVDHARTTTEDSEGEYGAHWWLRLAGEDSFHCSGFQGQYIVCVPSRDLIVVRLGVSQPEQRDTFAVWLREFVEQFD